MDFPVQVRLLFLVEYNQVNAVLEGLEGRAAQAIDLHYRIGASRGAIASQLAMQPDGVKSLLRRTRDVLRECVERKLRREDS